MYYCSQAHSFTWRQLWLNNLFSPFAGVCANLLTLTYINFLYAFYILVSAVLIVTIGMIHLWCRLLKNIIILFGIVQTMPTLIKLSLSEVQSAVVN